MVVATFKAGGGFGVRWALVIERWAIFLEKQVMLQPDVDDIITYSQNIKWRPCGDYFGAGFRKEFRFANDHTWYDGPHCAWNLGWFYITWSYWDCKKCSSDKTE